MKCLNCKSELDEVITCVETGWYDIYSCNKCEKFYRREHTPSALYEITKEEAEGKDEK